MRSLQCLKLNSKDFSMNSNISCYIIPFSCNFRKDNDYTSRVHCYISWTIKEHPLSFKNVILDVILKKPPYVLASVCVFHRHECVCVWERSAKIKKAFSWRIFPPCWAPAGAGRTETCLCRTDVIGLTCLCCTKALGITASVHTIPIQAGCFAPASLKNNVIICFSIIKLDFCRKLNRQNLYQTMLRVGWQYNPPPLSLSMCFSLFLCLFFTSFPSFSLTCSLSCWQETKSTFTGVKQTVFLCINKCRY